MSENANWSYPTQVLFGQGRVSQVVEYSTSAGMKRPLLVADANLASTSMVQNVLDRLKDNLPSVALFSDVAPNPDEQNLKAGITAFLSGNHDGVIAMGGGSALDLGKLVALMAHQTIPVWDLEDVGDWWTRADASQVGPVIAIPTTAGTGSEVGRAGVLTNSATHTKKIIFHPDIMPKTVICDPELTVSMPPAITAGTGMDAFAHCLEAYCSPHYHPMSAGIAIEGMRLVKEFLPRAYNMPNDIEARSHMMSAAMMGAVAFQKGLGAIHALSHPIGALYNTHHGTTNAVLMSAVLRFNRLAIEDKINRLTRYLEIEGGFDGFVEFVETINRSLRIPVGLHAMGLDNVDVERIATMALEDPSAGGNPVKLTLDGCKSMLADAA